MGNRCGARADRVKSGGEKRARNEHKVRVRAARNNETIAGFQKGCKHMEHIVRIDGEKVYVSDGNGGLTEAPLSAVQYENPAEGDDVRIFEIDGGLLISRISDVEAEYMGTGDDVF